MSELQKMKPFGSLRLRARSPEVMGLHRPDCALHIAQFYERDEMVTGSVAQLAKKTLHQGDSVVLVATPDHLSAIEKVLDSGEIDLAALRTSGRYLALDAAAALTTFMRDGSPDQAKFDETIGRAVSDAVANSANGFAFAFGEMVALLCAADKHAVAIQLERIWNALAIRHRFSLYCAYPLSVFRNGDDVDALLSICSEHSLAVPAEPL